MLAEEAGRRALIADLERSAAMPDADPWFGIAAVLARFASVAHGHNGSDHAAGVVAAATALAPIAARSPWMAWRAMATICHCAKAHGCVTVRRALRRGWLALGSTITAKPSVLLDVLRARDPGWGLWSVDTAGSTIALLGPEILRTLTARRSVEEIDAAVAALGPGDGLAARATLLDEFLSSHRHLLDWDDADTLRRIMGPGLACGMVMDAMPTAVLWETHPEADSSFVDSMAKAFWPADRDFDVAALDAALAAIRWDDTAVESVVEDIRLRLGSPVAALRLADACDAHGLAKRAAALRDGVRRHFAIQEEHFRIRGMNPRELANRLWRPLMVFATSTATSDLAIACGQRHLAGRGEAQSWAAGNLSMAQALLAAGRKTEAVEQLVQSFAGIESTAHDEPFVVPAGVLHGQPAMREWILGQLRDAGVLDAVARRRIIAAAKAEMLTPGALAILGVDAKKLGNGVVGGNPEDF